MSSKKTVAKVVLGTALVAGSLSMSGCAASKCGSGKCGSKHSSTTKTVK
ncbi:MAG: hypothetical protein OEW60_04570 [Thiovulaceae bacterium]|nr:hypothetical protein [Sulfurimonadaceae bacterium]